MKTVSVMLAAILAIACSNNDFKGSDANRPAGPTANKPEKEETPSGLSEEPKKEEASVDQKNESVTPEEAEDILQEDGELSDDDKKILGCLQEWGHGEFSADALKGYRTLTSSNEGFASSTIKDSKTTKEPRLVLVKANSVGFAGVRLELMNAMGWYCIDVKNTGFSSSDLLLHCEAEVAGYNQENKGFSNSKETRVGC